MILGLPTQFLTGLMIEQSGELNNSRTLTIRHQSLITSVSFTELSGIQRKYTVKFAEMFVNCYIKLILQIRLIIHLHKTKTTKSRQLRHGDNFKYITNIHESCQILRTQDRFISRKDSCEIHWRIYIFTSSKFNAK